MKQLLCVLLITATGMASAQTTYRWTDPATGNTIFSDQPPPPEIRKVTKKTGRDAGEDGQQSYPVRPGAEKFPVTLYTSADCTDTCQQARSLLNGRGIPFTEKLVQGGTPEADELKQLTGGEGFVPVILVGRQSNKGLDKSAWNNLLDLAGYPKTAAYGSKPSGAFAK